MPSGYRSGGVDFDDLFDPYVEGQKSVATGRRVAGVDLNQRYAPISYGTKRADVGYRVGGIDVSNLWAAKGTAQYLRSVSSVRMSPSGAPTSASLSAAVRTNGQIVFNALTGGTVSYDTTAGPLQFRISGAVSGIRNSSSSGTMTGKGGVSFTAAVHPGNSAGFDTGWNSADDSANFLDLQCNSSANIGTASLDGTFDVQIRRASSGEVIRSFSVAFSCIADSQQ